MGLIVAGVVSRYGAGDLDDLRQEAWALVLHNLRRVRPDGKAFNYITCVVKTACGRQRRR